MVLDPPTSKDSVSSAEPKQGRTALSSFGRPTSIKHRLTYVCVFVFTVIVYFRPYELYPSLRAIPDMAFWAAIIMLSVYLVVQVGTRGTLTTLYPESTCILLLGCNAVVSSIYAWDSSLAWNSFNETFSKVIVTFIVLANVLTTERRIVGLIWLGVAVGAYFSSEVYTLYNQGVFNIEGYRVTGSSGGMLANPNEMSIHLAMFIPLAITLGISSKSYILKIILFGMTAIMTIAIVLTQSRGGFLGLIVAILALALKLGTKKKFRSVLLLACLVIIIIIFAPGNYGSRIASIFDSTLDSTGSSTGRQASLERSLLVTAANPFGIGLANSPLADPFGLETHNAYTQVSSELGWIALGVYLAFLIYPVKQLSKIEASMKIGGQTSRLYYLVVGTRAAILSFMATSFFASVAYQWYVYYPVAFAIGLRGIYKAQITAAVNHSMPVSAGQEQRSRGLASRRRYFIPG